MRTEDILDYSTELIGKPRRAVGQCELLINDGAVQCGEPGYFYEGRIYSPWLEFLCEDHLLYMGVDGEKEVYEYGV